MFLGDNFLFLNLSIEVYVLVMFEWPFVQLYIFYLIGFVCIAGREDWFGLYGCGSFEEIKQEQEIGQEACQEVSCLFGF